MEASAAGLAASGDAAQGEAQQGEGQEQQGQDAISQLAEQLTGLQQGQEQMREYLQSNPWQAQQEPEAEPEQPPDLSFLDETSPNYDPEQAAQRLQDFMREQGKTAAEERLSAELEPMRQELADMKAERAADMLASEFTEMKDPQVAEQVIGTAEKYAQILDKPELVGNFDFIRLTYMAERAAQMQAEGRGETPTEATLEGAGGASPGAAQGEMTTESITQNWGKGNDLFGPR